MIHTKRTATRQACAYEEHEIPPITDPLGKHWDQPPRAAMRVDDKDAWMTKATLDQLAEYSTSIPSGTYSGKAWKRQIFKEGAGRRLVPTGEFFLGFYGEIKPAKDGRGGEEIEIHWRRVHVVESLVASS